MRFTATCINCNYDLRELPPQATGECICPECGRAFNPQDKSTYRSSHVLICWRAWARYPSVVEVTVAITAALIHCYAYSAPGVPYTTVPQFVGLMAMCSWAILLIVPFVFFGRLAAMLRDRQRARLDRHPFQTRSRWRMILFGCAMLLGTGNIFTNWSLRLRFALSEKSLNVAIERYQQNDSTTAGYVGWIGLFHIEDAWGDSTGEHVQLKIAGSDPAGICYWPRGPVGGRYIHMKGPWYAVEFRPP